MKKNNDVQEKVDLINDFIEHEAKTAISHMMELEFWNQQLDITDKAEVGAMVLSCFLQFIRELLNNIYLNIKNIYPEKSFKASINLFLNELKTDIECLLKEVEDK